MTRRAPGQLGSALAEGESVLAVSDCVPVSEALEALPDQSVRTAVLTDRALYCSIGDADVVPLPFARMRELSRRGIALLFFRIDDSHATWELRDSRFAERAEKRFAAHGLIAQRTWVGTVREPGQEPAAFRHHAHVDLLTRLTAGADLADAVLEQRSVVDQLVFATTGDRALARAAVGRLGRVHRQVHTDLQVLAEAAPSLALAQHAMVLVAQPSPWEGPEPAETGEGPDVAGLAGLTPDSPLVRVAAERAPS